MKTLHNPSTHSKLGSSTVHTTFRCLYNILRVQHQRAFAVVGIDHTGPVLVRDGTVTKKSWILLFVCATTRAAHLEVVMSLSASDVLLAYRRFMAMYGEPAIIKSDNGTTFAAASKQLSVDWRFNPPSAPWHGGFFERLVAVIKAPLRKVLGRSLVSVVELRTVLAEVQAIVNDRPLTHVSTFDEPLPLTPNMLLGRQAGVKATIESSLSAEHAVKRLQYISRLRTSIDQRWSEEYLTSLRLHAARHANNVKAGNVVLLADNQKKRVMWKMALVEELFPGRDDKFRVARVKVGNLRLLRPVQKLVPMELKQSGDPVEQLPLPEPLQPMQPPVQHQQQQPQRGCICQQPHPVRQYLLLGGREPETYIYLFDIVDLNMLKLSLLLLFIYFVYLWSLVCGGECDER